MNKFIIENKSNLPDYKVFRRLSRFIEQEAVKGNDYPVIENEGIVDWHDGDIAEFINNEKSHRIVFYEREN
jgi:hypothetical protein